MIAPVGRLCQTLIGLKENHIAETSRAAKQRDRHTMHMDNTVLAHVIQLALDVQMGDLPAPCPAMQGPCQQYQQT